MVRPGSCVRLFCGQPGDSTSQLQVGGKAKLLSEAYHRYTLNYINALNYLESLRRHQDFCDFEKVTHFATLHLYDL